MNTVSYDALCLLSYGGPEGIGEIEPYLNRLLAGKSLPPARREAVIQKYLEFDGISPIAGEVRSLLARLKLRTTTEGRAISLFQASLYSNPSIQETSRLILSNPNIHSVLVLPLSPFDTPQRRKRYIEKFREVFTRESESHSLERDPPSITFAPPYYTNSLYVRACSNTVLRCLADRDLEKSLSCSENEEEPLLLFSAHALPNKESSLFGYHEQLDYLIQEVVQATGITFPWRLVFQSRSGSPSELWTEPEIEDVIREYKTTHPNWTELLVCPIGFMLENMETVYDLDVSIGKLGQNLGLTFNRAPCVAHEEEILCMLASFF